MESDPLLLFVVKEKTMHATFSQKVGIFVFGIGVVFVVGVGWLYSWWMVPAIREYGFQNVPVPGMVSFIWGLSAPVGSLIALAGAGMYAQVSFRRLIILVPGIFCVVFLTAILSPPFNASGPFRY